MGERWERDVAKVQRVEAPEKPRALPEEFRVLHAWPGHVHGLHTVWRTVGGAPDAVLGREGDPQLQDDTAPGLKAPTSPRSRGAVRGGRAMPLMPSVVTCLRTRTR